MLTKAIQESILSLLIWNKDDGRKASMLLTARDFDPSYRDLADVVLEYWEKRQIAPRDHIQDLLGDVLDQDDGESSELSAFLHSLYELSKDLNADFILSKVRGFVKVQRVKEHITDAAELILQKGVDSEERLEEIIDGINNIRVDSFDAGIRLNEALKLNLSETNDQPFTLGIKPLDDYGALPARKQFLLFIGGPKAGKSMFLIHCGKRALMQRLKVLYVTLELADQMILTRCVQSLFSIPKRSDVINLSKVRRSRSTGKATALRTVQHKPKIYLQDDAGVRKFLAQELSSSRFGNRIGNNLIIKEFPTGSLTVSGLKRYLDILESTEKFIPDVLLIDYADLMKPSTRNGELRTQLGDLYVDLRGLAVERNICLVSASQSNAKGVQSNLIDTVHAAEAFSKIGIVDVVLTLSKTKAESELNLARLFVAASRADKDKYIALITQNYDTCQFCLSSALMPSMGIYKSDFLNEIEVADLHNQ